MRSLLITTLLLAGCAPAPKPEAEITLAVDSATTSTTTVTVGPMADSNFYSIGGTSFYAASKQYPIARFHYKGGAWCNVWADDKGIHWEVCK